VLENAGWLDPSAVQAAQALAAEGEAAPAKKRRPWRRAASRSSA
jgi:hypothetical protein